VAFGPVADPSGLYGIPAEPSTYLCEQASENPRHTDGRAMGSEHVLLYAIGIGIGSASVLLRPAPRLPPPGRCSTTPLPKGPASSPGR
jgi:hypothetical protein